MCIEIKIKPITSRTCNIYNILSIWFFSLLPSNSWLNSLLKKPQQSVSISLESEENSVLLWTTSSPSSSSLTIFWVRKFLLMIQPEAIDTALQGSAESKIFCDIFSPALLGAIIKIWSLPASLLLCQPRRFDMEVFEREKVWKTLLWNAVTLCKEYCFMLLELFLVMNSRWCW